MIQFLLVSIFASAALSLLSYVYCWHDIRTGRPHIISLRQITSIMDRGLLNRVFGSPDPGYYYPLSPVQLYVLVKTRQWFYYRECAADILCLFGAWAYMTGFIDTDTVGWFILLAGLCQAINITHSIHLINKWSSQIREEIENSED